MKIHAFRAYNDYHVGAEVNATQQRARDLSFVRVDDPGSIPVGLGNAPTDLIGGANKIRHELALGLKIDLPRRALLHDHSGAHDSDSIRHRKSFDLVMGHV